MVVHVYSCLLTGIIPVQIHSGIITWNGTGIFMNIQAYSCSWNFRKAGLYFNHLSLLTTAAGNLEIKLPQIPKGAHCPR